MSSSTITKRFLKDWGYGDPDGKSSWASRYPLSLGEFQSPINIETNKGEVQYDPYLENVNPLVFSEYSMGWNPFQILNDGTTLKILPAASNNIQSINGGPLQSAYKLDHFHFHWGSHGIKGSEHRVNGKSYDGEVHFVHWNNNFQSLTDAFAYYQGLCVVAVFLKKGENNPEYDEIVQNLPKISHYHDNYPISQKLDLLKLMPDNLKQYWTYPGSLTTPPFSETVTWIIFKNPIEISEDQLKQLFSLKSSELDEEGNMKLMQNIYRDPQALNGRIVRSSFNTAAS